MDQEPFPEPLVAALRTLLEQGFTRERMTALRSLDITVKGELSATGADHQLELPIVDQLSHFAFTSHDDPGLVISDTWRRFFGVDSDRDRDRPKPRTGFTRSQVMCGHTLERLLPCLTHRFTGIQLHLEALGLGTLWETLAARPLAERHRIRRLSLVLCWNQCPHHWRVRLATLSVVLHFTELTALAAQAGLL